MCVISFEKLDSIMVLKINFGQTKLCNTGEKLQHGELDCCKDAQEGGYNKWRIVGIPAWARLMVDLYRVNNLIIIFKG